MKETNIIKRKSCGKCRHFMSLRSGQEKGTCEAYIAIPFWMMRVVMVNNVVHVNDGQECHLFMDKPNGVEDEFKS